MSTLLDSLIVDSGATGATQYSVCSMDTDLILAVYESITPETLYGRLIFWDGSELSLLESSPFELTTEGITTIRIKALTTGKAFISYAHNGSPSGLYCNVIQLAENTINSIGTRATIHSSSFISNSDMDVLSSSKAVTVYRNPADSSTGYARVTTISGTTITVGASTYQITTHVVNSLSIKRISDTRAIVVYANSADNTPYAVVIDISGTVVTPGTPQQISTDSTGSIALRKIDVAVISETQFIFSYIVDSTPDIPKVVGATLSGTTFTFGSEITLTNDSSDTIVGLSFDLTSSNKAFLSTGRYRYDISLSGTTAIEDESETTPDFNNIVLEIDKANSIVAMSRLSGNFVVSYFTDGTIDYGLILSDAGLRQYTHDIDSSSNNLFFALEEESTGNQVIIKYDILSEQFNTVYDPQAGDCSNVIRLGTDLDNMLFFGNFGTDVKLIKHTISTLNNSDISPASLGSNLLQPVESDPLDSNHIIAIDQDSEDVLESLDLGSNWNTINNAIGGLVLAIKMLWNNIYYPDNGFIGLYDGVDTALFFTPNNFENTREDSSAALQSASDIVSLDIG